MAQQPQRTAAAPAANATMSTSPAGLTTLATREGQGGTLGNPGGHYNDSANNCTVGTGLLAHLGPCTAAELTQRADAGANATEFDTRVRDAETRIRAGVRHRPLNQNQFDALVSAAFNSGGGIAPALRDADNNNDVGVAVHLRKMVHVHNRDQHGNIAGPPVISRGLVNRRAEEITQYNTPIAPPAGRRR